MPLYWMSYVDPKKPAGSRFLGVTIIAADDFSCAIREAWARRINPGGEIQSREFPPDIADKVPQEYRNRLLSRSECDELDKIL